MPKLVPVQAHGRPETGSPAMSKLSGSPRAAVPDTARDEVFENEAPRTSDFRFDAKVAEVFDDMLLRSVPYYLEQQRMLVDVVGKFRTPGTTVYDLGCSTANTLINVAKALGPDAPVVGYDNSVPMLEHARRKVEVAGLSDQVQVRFGDLENDIATLDLSGAGVVTMCWTLQFIRPLGRDALIRKIHDSLAPGGALVITEKVLTADSDMNRYFVEFYYDFKRRNGYSQREIMRKREALENVLVPYRVSENLELLNRCGFQTAETFFQWYNFAGFLAVKKPL